MSTAKRNTDITRLDQASACAALLPVGAACTKARSAIPRPVHRGMAFFLEKYLLIWPSAPTGQKDRPPHDPS